MNQKAASMAIILAGIAWGIISIFIRRLAAAGLALPEIVMLRMLVSALLLGIFLGCFDREKFKVSGRDLWLFIGTGVISLAGFNCCYFYTVMQGFAAVGGVLLYTAPAFIMVLARWLFQERFTLNKFIALLLTVSGCVLISGIAGKTGMIPGKVLFFGIASGLLYGLYSIFGKFALTKYDTRTVIFYTFVFSAGSLFFCTDSAKVWQICTQTPDLGWYLAGLGGICTVLPYFFYTWGLQKTTTVNASILAAVEPLVCAVLGICIYQETAGWDRIAGVVFILAAIILQSIPQKSSSCK